MDIGMEKIRRVKFDIDKTNPSSGVKTMSLVSEPAIESDFKYFSKEKEKKKYIELKTATLKQVVAGLALIPDKDILRFDTNGEPFYGYFTTDSIETIRNQFHKQQMTSNVNVEHEEPTEGYLIESFIIDTPELLSATKAKGIPDATLGSWYVAYKIEDPAIFQKVIDGELRGFSVEIYLSKLTAQKDDNNFSKIEQYMNKFLEKFKTLLSEMEKAETIVSNKETKALQKLADESLSGSTDVNQAKTIPDDILLTWSDVGQPVLVINDNDPSNTSPAPAGVYNLDNGKQLTVGDDGNLVSIGDAQLSKQSKAQAPVKEDFKAENETLKAEIQNLKSEIEKLKKLPLANPIQKNETKEDLAKKKPEKPLAEMTAAERMRFKYNF
ncbi:hypothetical protein WSM22_03370 [Cytophagales bacterium WSM2-2]|nr:hypothetical protein WSM22_03370 [Cytophagales bacterium WSM2-2]